jgi:hypothetical protein
VSGEAFSPEDAKNGADEERPVRIIAAVARPLQRSHIGDRGVHGKHGADDYGDFPRPVENAAPKRWRVLSLIVGRFCHRASPHSWALRGALRATWLEWLLRQVANIPRMNDGGYVLPSRPSHRVT